MPQFNLLAAAVESRSRAASAQALVNLYPEVAPDGSVTLYSTPGLSLFASVGFGPVRGLFVNGNVLLAVSGDRVYSVDSTGTATLLGSIGTSSGPVSMAGNGQQVQLVDGSATGYVITGSILQTITDTDFPGGVTNAFVDGFIMFNEPSSGRVWQGEGYAADSQDPLKFSTAEGAPDDVVSILADHRELWIFGHDSTEIQYNAGAAGYSFERISGAFIEHGCAAAHSPQKIDNTVFWLGKDANGDGMVWRADGYTPRRVSTHDIEKEISSYSRLDDAVGWTYQQDGHSFYLLTFPTADATWCFDVAADKWHRRGYFESGVLHRHRANCHAFFAGQHIVGDWENGNLYVLSMEAFSDNGDEICREIITQHFRAGGRAIYGSLEIRMEVGVGLQTGQGTDPQVQLSISNDQGQTWGPWMRRSMGRVGQYLERVVFHRLGSGYSKTFRIRITDPVKVVLAGANVEVR